MLRSKFCHLSGLTPDQIYAQGECYHELGGYFIIDGGERVLLSQERLGNNLYYAGNKAYKAVKIEDEELFGGETAERGEERSFFGAIRSVSEDGTRGPSSHYLEIPPKAKQPDFNDFEELNDLGYNLETVRLGKSGRIPVITLPGFKEPIPALSIFRASGISNDKDLYDTILAAAPEETGRAPGRER